MKFPSVCNIALLPSVPQKLRKQVLEADFSSIPGKRGIWGLLTYKTQYSGTSITLPGLCQSSKSQPGLDSKPFIPRSWQGWDPKAPWKKKVSPSPCVTNCWKRQMEGMTGKAIISSGLPFCLDSKETNTKFHHRLKCYLNILENVVLLSEIGPALLPQPVTY